jgi:hypothetical protein
LDRCTREIHAIQLMGQWTLSQARQKGTAATAHIHRAPSYSMARDGFQHPSPKATLQQLLASRNRLLSIPRRARARVLRLGQVVPTTASTIEGMLRVTHQTRTVCTQRTTATTHGAAQRGQGRRVCHEN